MFVVEFAVILLVIYLGTKLKGICIGFTGGFGVFILTTLFQIKPGNIPFDIIEMMMVVVSATSTMQAAGGIDYLSASLAKRLRRNPKYITFFAPLITWFMTIISGTGHAAFSVLPVIIEVAKEYGIRPSRPLSISVIASQIAITASPISASVVFFAGILEPIGVSYLTLLGICIPVTFISIMITAAFCNFMGCELENDPIYQKRLLKKEVNLNENQLFEPQPYAKLSVIFFLIGILMLMFYTIAISDTIKIIRNPLLLRNEAIMLAMLSISALISFICKVDASKVLNTNTFKFGISACVCVLGVAWLGDTFIKAHLSDIHNISSNLLHKYPWLLAVILFLAATLLYSQAATTKAVMPTALMLGVSPLIAIASFAAVSALFVFPTYPTILAAIEMDDTGSTSIGKYLFNHTFMLPGLIAVILCITFGFISGSMFL